MEGQNLDFLNPLEGPLEDGNKKSLNTGSGSNLSVVILVSGDEKSHDTKLVSSVSCGATEVVKVTPPFSKESNGSHPTTAKVFSDARDFSYQESEMLVEQEYSSQLRADQEDGEEQQERRDEPPHISLVQVCESSSPLVNNQVEPNPNRPVESRPEACYQEEERRICTSEEMKGFVSTCLEGSSNKPMVEILRTLREATPSELQVIWQEVHPKGFLASPNSFVKSIQRAVAKRRVVKRSSIRMVDDSGLPKSGFQPRRRTVSSS